MSNIAGTVAVFVFTAAFSFVSFAARPPAVSEVKPFGGVPALWIDGRPDTGLMHWNRWPKPEDIAVYEDALYAANTAKQAGFYTIAVRDDSNQPHWETLTALADEVILDWQTAAQTL